MTTQEPGIDLEALIVGVLDKWHGGRATEASSTQPHTPRDGGEGA